MSSTIPSPSNVASEGCDDCKRRCDGCKQMVPFVDLRTVMVQDDALGYLRLQLCQQCRVTR